MLLNNILHCFKNYKYFLFKKKKKSEAIISPNSTIPLRTPEVPVANSSVWIPKDLLLIKLEGCSLGKKDQLLEVADRLRPKKSWPRSREGRAGSSPGFQVPPTLGQEDGASLDLMEDGLTPG